MVRTIQQKEKKKKIDSKTILEFIIRKKKKAIWSCFGWPYNGTFQHSTHSIQDATEKETVNNL